MGVVVGAAENVEAGLREAPRGIGRGAEHGRRTRHGVVDVVDERGLEVREGDLVVAEHLAETAEHVRPAALRGARVDLDVQEQIARARHRHSAHPGLRDARCRRKGDERSQAGDEHDA